MEEIILKNSNISVIYSQLEYNLITTKIISFNNDKKWICEPNNNVITIYRNYNKAKCFEFEINLVDDDLYSISSFKVNKQFFKNSNKEDNDKLYIDMLIYLINRVILKNNHGSPPNDWNSIRIWSFIGSDALPEEINSDYNFN